MKRKSAHIPLLRAFLPAAVLAGSFVLGLTAADAAQYQYSSQLCTDCHGMPPGDSNATFRNVTTGAVRGNHQTHANGSQSSCEKCHIDSATFSTNHSDGGILMSSNINASPSPAKGVYGPKPAFFNQTSNPVLGNCSNVNCHFEKVTPTWGSATFASPGDCGQCHGAPPAGSAGAPGTAGSHAKHDLYYTGTGKCVRCHSDHTAEANKFAHATSLHNIVVAPRDPANSPAGSYSGSGANFLPSQQGSQNFGTCSATYCHSNGQSASGPYSHTAIQWGGSAGCTSCHDGAAGATTLSGKHPKHLNATTYGFTCNYCHYDTTNNGSTISNYSTHVNKHKDVAFATPSIRVSTSTWNGSQCVNVYCHGNGQSLTPTVTTDWSGSIVDCAGCHNHTTIASGSHVKHVNTDTNSCTKCHNDSVSSGYGNINFPSPKHVNRSVDIRLSTDHPEASPFYNGTSIFGHNYAKTPGAAYARCSGLYCHSDGKRNAVYRTYSSKKWGGASIGCNGCHGNDASPAFTPVAGEPNYANTANTPNSHLQHVKGFGYTSTTDCARCHLRTVSKTVANSFGSYTTHLHGTPNVSIDGIDGRTGTYDSGTRQCSATYCHGSVPSPAWGNNVATCIDCHAASNSGYWATNSAHRLHWESTALPSSYANYSGNVSSAGVYRFTCSSCHSPAKGATHATGPANANGAAQVFFGFTSATRRGSYAYGTTQGTTDNIFKWTDSGAGCNTTYCHSDGNGGNGNNSEVGGWIRTTNSVTASRCGACHGYTTASGTAIGTANGTARHSSHINGATYSFSCAACHNATTTDGATITDKSRHVNKKKDVSWDSTNSGGTAYVNSSTKCDNIYCHSRGTATSAPYDVTSAPIARVQWDTSAFLGCTGCHGDAGTTGANALSGKHQNHVNNATVIGSNFACVDCHAKTVDASGFISTYTNHVNKFKDYSGTRAGGSASYAGGTCSNSYCHSSGKRGQLGGVTGYTEPTAPSWSSASLDCKGCHGGSSSLAGEPTYTGGASGTVKANSHQKHVTVGATDCVKCHFKITSNGTAILAGSTRHIDRTFDVNFSKRSSYTTYSGAYNSSARTCSATYCHGGANTTPAWGGSTQCNTCHNAKANDANWAAASAHKFHWEGTDLPSSYTMTPGNTTGDTATYRFACSSCHSPTKGAGHANTPVSAYSAAEVYFGYTSPILRGTWSPNSAISGTDNGFNWASGSTCGSTYCHSNGASQASAGISGSWGTNSSSGTNRCNLCHGNSTYTDFRRGTPLYGSGSITHNGAAKGNAHDRHTNVQSSLTGKTYMTCDDCHAPTTRTNTAISDKTKHVNKSYDVGSDYQFGTYSSYYRDGDDTVDRDLVTLTYNYSPSGSSCSNVSCHPVAADLTQSPPVPKTRDTSSVKWNAAYSCVDCHNIAMQDTSTFHHAMRSYSSSYPTAVPNGDALTGTNSLSRRCTMCHVDHNIFSPDLNPNSTGRSYNLRTDITVTPTSTTGYTNSDYVNSGNGGICITCHKTARTKDTSRRRQDPGVTVTPVITLATYSASSHQYMVSAKFMSDNSTVNGDCSKCHNALLGETSVFANATSVYQFGNHNSGVRRLQGSLDAAGGETAEEQICYRCHSHSTDADPGGGPPKAVDGKDYYGVAGMVASTEGIFQANKFWRSASATSSTNKLFFKPAGAETPSENMPNPTTNDGDLGDTFAGGTYVVRSMSPWATTTPYTTDIKSQTTNLANTRYWKMAKFVSPLIASATTVPAGTWTINIYSRESSTNQNAYVRYMVYKWNVGGADAKGTTIIAKGTYATELATTSAPGVNRQIAINVPATTFSANEKIVVDLALQTSTGSTTSYTAYYYFGAGAPSNLTLPGNITFTYADPGSPGFGHGPAGYFGVHKPSTTDETLAVIAQNRHVECNDCHNPHSASNGLMDDYGTATAGGSNYLDNTVKHWVTNQWANRTIAIMSGTGSGQTRTISSNTGTRVTVSSNWTTTPDSTSVYKIIGNTNMVSGVMRNVPGASVSYPVGNWTTSMTYSLVNASTYEYNVCFKCHAKTNATENTLKYWNVTSASLQAKRWTDIGLEFNPNNQSYHPVVSALPATDPSASYGSDQLAAAQLINGWTPGMLMSCTDCHDSTSAATGSRGPHGSSVKWMLAGPNRAWPYQGAANNGETAGTYWTYNNRATGLGTSDGLFCYNCHPSTAPSNHVHTKEGVHMSSACVECHIRVPHGGKVSRLMAAAGTTWPGNLPKRYAPDGNGNRANTWFMQKFTKASSYSSYIKDNCLGTGNNVSGGSCGSHSGTSATESW